MITKILITLLVIGGAYLVLKQRAERSSKVRSAEAKAAAADDGGVNMRLAAYLFIFVMLCFSATWLYLEWRDSYREVTVTVINADSGARISYQARLGDVEGYSFSTIDGRKVTVAANERIEVGGGQ